MRLVPAAQVALAALALAPALGQAIDPGGAPESTPATADSAAPAPAEPPSEPSPQRPRDSSPGDAPEPSAPLDDADDPRWSLAISLTTYFVPDSREYVQPTIAADRGLLHLEARYNYEGLDTGSLWVGCNFAGGEELTWEVTPMLGGVFGETTGIAPGYEATLQWWKLELYSEGEYVIDTGDASNSYFYNWSELSIYPLEWLRLGIVAERTRLYRGDRDIQRGVLVGVTFERLDITAYLFNPDDDKPLLVLAVELGF